MYENSLFKYNFYSTIFFSFTYWITFELAKNINYYEKNIHNFIIPENLPSLKNIYYFNDLSLSLLIFLFIYLSIDKIFKYNDAIHLKIVWILKCYCSLFLAIVYEVSTGLDQVVYFNIVINNLNYYYHFEDISKLFDFTNSTVNLLFPLRVLNYIFPDSWYMNKILYNIFFLLIVILSLNSLRKILPQLKDNTLIIYLISFFPSLFFFSSLINKVS